MIRIVAMTTYPVKGCAGTPLRTAAVGPAGLPEDRAFMVVDANGVYRTQRGSPLLAGIRPRMSDDDAELTLRADGRDPVIAPVRHGGSTVEVDLFGAPLRAVDQGDVVADWVSDVLGEQSRLVRVPPEHDRISGGVRSGPTGFADSCAVHVVSLASVDLLNERIASRGGEPVPTDRFRPNIVLGGCPPHAEDTMDRLVVGDAELGFAKLAVRCAVTMVDQDAGVRDGPEPLRTLATYRRGGETAVGDGGTGVVFGAKFTVLTPGAARVGDPVG